ncbi:MAG: cyclic nucleotide-binding domain-containing protein [Hyphomicrobiales bacterium]|nr:cyclic nucleotide-binding domain-containing protein [Methylobacteriaceae bacterium]MCC2104777.1 cyclic nucleotide-binding domain-containing protein [Hyphomicrobiales bacterium]HRY04261.1 cyclic nucleotide-binding domain-containing protein [Beijerinckiaceae bacterium]
MALDDDIRLFEQVPVFRLLEPDALRLLAFSAETKLLRAGDVLCAAPARLEGGYLVLKGSLAIFDTRDALGEPSKVVYSPGLVGELAMIADTEAAGSIISREPTTLLRVSRAVFHRILSEYPRSADAVRRMVSERLSSLSSQLTPLA